MYVLIYDYIGETDSCYGITERCNTWKEAEELKRDLMQSDVYCNFTIVKEE